MLTTSASSGRISTERIFLALGLVCASLVGVAALFTPYPMLAPAAATGFIAGLFVIRFPELALYGLIVGIFFTGGDNPLSSLRIHGAIKIAAPLLLVFALARSIAVKNSPLSSNQKISLFFAISFCAYAISSWIAGPDSTEDASFLLLQRLAISVSLFISIVLLRDRLKSEWLLGSLVIGAATSGFLTLLLDTAHPENGREAGFLGDPNLYSAYLVAAIPIATYFYFRTRQIGMQLIALLLIALIAFTTLQTGSRAGLLVCVLGLLSSFCFGLKSQIKSMKQLLTVGSILTVSLAIIVLPQASKIFDRSSSTEIQTSLGELDRSTARRLSYIQVGIQLIAKDPILGNGLGSFPKEFANSNYSKVFMTSKELFPLYRRAHNSFLEILSELGIFGFALFAGVHLVSFLTLITTAYYFEQSQKHQPHQIRSFLCISLVSIWLMMITLSIYEMYLLWVVCAASLIVVPQEEIHD